MTTNAARAALIRRSTQLTTLPGLSGQRLHLITPAVPELYFATSEDDLPFPEPWWGFLWPGGWGLTQFVQKRPRMRIHLCGHVHARMHMLAAVHFGFSPRTCAHRAAPRRAAPCLSRPSEGRPQSRPLARLRTHAPARPHVCSCTH